MALSSNFPIVINLSYFYRDHRQRARIFVNENIQTIKDLQKRIENVFHIENFHLSAQNEYLPPSEDVRILKMEEVVWAIPSTPIAATDVQQKSEEILFENQEPLKPKKRVRSSLNGIGEDLCQPVKTKQRKYDKYVMEEELDSSELATSKVKSKIKNKRIYCEENIELEKEKHSKHSPKIFDQPKIKKQKKKADEPRDDHADIHKILAACPISSDASNDEEKSCKKSSVTEQIKDEANVYACKGNLSAYTKNEPIPTITDQYLKQKKINIVQIDYIVGKPMQLKNENIKEANKEMKEPIADSGKDKSKDSVNSKCNEDRVSNTSSQIQSNSNALTESNRNINSIDVTASPEDQNASNNNAAKIVINAEMEHCVNNDASSSSIKTDDRTTDVGENGKKCIPKHQTKPKFFFLTSPNSFNENNKSIKGNSDKEKLDLETPCDNSGDPRTYVQKFFKYLSPRNLPQTIAVNLTKDPVNVITVPENADVRINEDDKGKNGKPIINLSNKSDNSKVPEVSSEKLNLEQSSHDLSAKAEEASDCFLSTTYNSRFSDISHDISENSPTSRLDIYDANSYGVSGIAKLSPDISSKSFKKNQISGLGLLLDDLRSNVSTISVSSAIDSTLESDSSQFVTQRRHRRRVRKRKNKSKDSEKISIATHEPCAPKPMNVQARPLIHIKFNEDEKGGESNEVPKGTLQQSVGSGINLTEKDILGYQLMKHMMPRVADVILFKILRMTENYTPHVSSYITGHVLSYTMENKHVLFEIISGLEQCGEPKGKLSIDTNETAEDCTNQREFCWTDLIEPRLIIN